MGSSFDNFAPSPPSTSMEGGVESSEFVPSVSQRSNESSTGNVTAGDEEGYNSSSISLKNDALEAHHPSKKPGTRVNSPQRSRGVEICDSSFCQASHAESFFIYTICDPLLVDQKSSSDTSCVVKRWRMDILSARKGRQISHGHHVITQRAASTPNGDSGGALDLESALLELHFLSPASILHVGDVRHMTALKQAEKCYGTSGSNPHV